jgi:ABC-type nickel/cobalt efflux system permease component RcnA
MRKIIIPTVILSGILALYLLMPQGTMAEILLNIQAQQRLFRETIGTDLRAIKDTHSLAATLSLMTAGFLYGVFHAIGPGHGKVIVASYMLANDTTLRKGIVITVLSSLLQALTAIVLVVGAFSLLGLQRAQTEQAAEYLDIASFALIFLVGGLLCKRGITPLLKSKPQHDHKVHHHHDEHHDHEHKEHHHHHEHHEGCSHAHAPDAQAVATAISPRQVWLMIVSIGIRPCTGAILLLLFACIIGIVWAGVLATLAMAVGTALSTSVVAIAAMQSKTWTLRLLQDSPSRLVKTQACFSVAGGSVLMIMAALLLAASFSSPQAGGNNPLHSHPLRQQGSTK